MSELSNDRILNVPEVARRIWRRKLIVLAAVILTTVAGAAWSLKEPTLHSATRVTMITLPPVNTEPDATQQASVLPSSLTTFLAILRTPTVLNPVLEEHPDIGSMDDFIPQFTAIAPSPLTITLTVTAETPEKARERVDSLTKSFVTNAPPQLHENPEHLHFRITSAPDVQYATVPPDHTTPVVASGLLGLILGIGLALLLPTFGGRLRG